MLPWQPTSTMTKNSHSEHLYLLVVSVIFFAYLYLQNLFITFKILAICNIFFLFIKIFSFLTFILGLTKSYLFFTLYDFFLEQFVLNKIISMYCITLPFFSLYFNCDNLHSFTVMDIFIFVLDMQSLHCLKILMFTFFFYVYTL